MVAVIHKWIRRTLRVLTGLCLTAMLLELMPIQLLRTYDQAHRPTADMPKARMMDRYDTYIHNQTSTALDGILSIEKVYWLNDSDLVAPAPNAAGYGTATSAKDLAGILEQAAELIGDTEMIFTTETPITPGTKIRYYYDETILVVVWKQLRDDSMYTFCEVKLAHPSQLRRFLAGGEYGSHIQVPTSQMAESVNAVVASSGDFYGYRREGVIVYNGQVRRADTQRVDTCYIDERGDLHFSYIGQLSTVEEAQAFVDERDIRFSLSFGPILVDNGEKVPIDRNYYLGQPADPYPRAALGQKGELHYVVTMVNVELGATGTIPLYSFQRNLHSLGLDKAYVLDGGQTATLVMNGEVVNRLASGSERYITDIFYFATAIPEG